MSEPCTNCLPHDCVETELSAWYALDGPLFDYQINCPSGYTCQNDTILLICCERILSVTVPPTATEAQRNAILASFVRECLRLEQSCDGPKIPDTPNPDNPGGGDPPPPVQLFGSNQAQCEVTCPQGGTFTYTIPAGKFVSSSQETADQYARREACVQARAHQICLLPATMSGCTNGVFTGTIRATGDLAKFDASHAESNFWEVIGTLPPGLTASTGYSLDKFLTISGTPTTAGTYTFTVKVTVFFTGETQSRDYTITIFGLTTANPLTDGIVNTAYSQTIATSGMTAPLTFRVSSGSLPTGLTLNTSTGVISGTPTTAGAYTFTIEATDSSP